VNLKKICPLENSISREQDTLFFSRWPSWECKHGSLVGNVNMEAFLYLFTALSRQGQRIECVLGYLTACKCCNWRW